MERLSKLNKSVSKKFNFNILRTVFFFFFFLQNRRCFGVFLCRLDVIIAAAASEPEANERGSSLISRRLHYRGLQSLFSY